MSIVDHYNRFVAQFMRPFTGCFRETKNINSVLPNELLIRIFNLVDEAQKSDKKAESRLPNSLPMRLTCRKWNKLISDKKNQQKLTRIRIPIGLIRIAQVGDSFGLYMIDNIDDEFITRFVKRDNHFWPQEMPQTSNKKLNPSLRSIEFDNSGFPCCTTQELNSPAWRIIQMKSYDKQTTEAKFTSNLLLKFNSLLERYEPQFVLIENIQLNQSLLMSISEILERYQRFSCLSVMWNTVNIAPDVTTADVQRLFANSLDLTGLHRRYSTNDFYNNFLASSTETNLKLNVYHGSHTYLLTYLEKVEYIWRLNITVDNLFEAIENRLKISNELEWHVALDCHPYRADERIRDAAFNRDFEEVETDPRKPCKNGNRFMFNDVEILIELVPTGHTSWFRLRAMPRQPQPLSRWDKLKKRLRVKL